MINIQNKEAYDVSTLQKDKIKINNTEYTITSVEYYDDTYDEGNIFGTAISRCLEFEIENIIDLEGKEFEYFTGIKTENGINWISLGNFITQSIEPNDKTESNKVFAIDYMLKSNIPYESNLDYKSGEITMLQVLEEVCSKSGLVLATKDFPNKNFIVDSNQFETEAINKQVIIAVAQMSGTIAKIKNDNKLYLINPNKITTISKIFTLNNYEEAKIKRQTHPINVVSIGMQDVEGENITLKDEASIETLGEENTIIFNDNPFAYTQQKREQLITALFNAIKGFEYKAFSFKCQGLPYLETLDKIQFRDKANNLYDSYILRFNYKSPNGLDSIIEAPSIIKAVVKYQNIPSLLNRLKHTEINVNKESQNIKLIAEEQTKQSNRITNVENETNTVASNLNTFINETYSNDISNLQNQIDGAIQFWNGELIPTLSNYPANEWTTEEQRNNHRADIYTVIQDIDGEMKQGKSYRFDKVGSTWQWVELTDNELSAVQALANSKAKVYVTTPIVPYNVGDLWLKDKELYECIKSKDASGSYSVSDWSKATKYTDDTKANEVDKKLTTTNEKVATIEINLDSITTRVSSTETKVTQVETTANTAKSTADTANNTANTAKNTAESAKSTADTANTNSNTAISTANTAKTNSETAVNTANTANTNANNAVSTANTASTNASNAISTANTAKSTADKAQNTANATAKEIVTTNTKVASIETNLTSITSRLSETETGIKDIEQAIDTEDRFIKQTEVQIDSVDNILDDVEMYGDLKQDTKVSSNILKSFDAGETSYFSSLTNKYTSDTNYYKAEPLADNWIHIECNLTDLTGEGKYINHFISPNKIPKLKTSTTYTIIYEFRNVDITTMSGSLTTLNTLESESKYFSDKKQINGSAIKNYNGKMYKVKSTTVSTFSGKYVMRNFHVIYPRDKFSYDYRISVLEGDKLSQDYTYEKYANRPSPEEEAKITVIGDNINFFDYENSFVKINNDTDTREIIERGNRIILGKAGTFRYSIFKIENCDNLLGKKVTLSGKINPSGTNNGAIGLFFAKSNYDVTSEIIRLKETGEKTITIPSSYPTNDTQIVLLLYGNSTSGTSKNGDYVDYTDVKLEIGEKATGYTSYGCGGIDYKTVGNQEKDVVIELPQGEFMAKIGNYEDYIDNKGVLHKYIGKVVLDGSETGWSALGYAFKLPSLDKTNYSVCTHFENSGSTWTGSDTSYRGKYSTSNDLEYWKFMHTDETITTTKEFKTWLSQNKPVIYYVLAEPYNVEITSENRKKYLNLPTIEGINNISISASTSATYKRNTEMNKVYAKQNYVDEKFAEQVITNDNITSRVSATETTISNQSSDISSLNESIGSVNSDINNLQSNVETVKTQYTELKETVESFNFDVVTQIQQQLEDGTVTSNQVKTTSVTIDQDGIKVAKSGSEMQSLFDNEGLYVNKGAIDKTETKNNTLTVDKDGVVTENLYVRTYLTAGYHRTEGFIEDGEKRTGVFYQGGVNE